MPADRKPMRFSHSEGHTGICYDDSGKHILTCGSDGDVRIYKGFDDSDPESIRAGERVVVIAVKENRIFTAADYSVQAFTFPEGSPDGILARFTAAVNHICFNQSGTVLAAASSDFNIKVVTVKDGAQTVFKGHEAPVLGVALDPKDQFLASSSCDGSMKIWNIHDQSCITTFNILPKVNDASASKTLCRLAWQPGSGKCIAVPVNREVRVYERETWKQLYSLADDGHSELVSITAWSPCGNYLASASINGEIFIWHIASQTLVERIKHENSLTISGLVWNPKESGEIAYTDNQGQFGVCENVIPAELSLQRNSSKKALSEDNDSLFADVMATDLNDDSDNESLVAKKRHRIKTTSWIDEAEDDEDDEFKDIRKLKAELAAPLDFGEGEIEADVDTASEVSAKKPQVIHTPLMPVLQRPFQPGSTPVHLTHRFMVWNSVGIVRCHNDDELSSIEVEFHDTNTHHPFHKTNELNHTMAALSSSALLLACQALEDLPSKLVCLHFGSWDRRKEWETTLPSGESIQAIALGSTWVAVATDKRLLRLFTLGGAQRQILTLPGPVVALSGHTTQLLVVFHLANPLPGEQALGVKLLDLHDNRQVLNDHKLPLSPKATLAWVGFSDEGTPLMSDSTGVLRLLDRSFGSTWTPVAATSAQLKNKSDKYWVVGVSEASRQIRCILCKGSTFPPTLPRPVLVVVPLQLPLCEMSTDKGKLEESYLLSDLLSNRFMYTPMQGLDANQSGLEECKTTQIQCIMKLFALACKSDREFRAAELCELLPDPHTVSLAIKYALQSRRMKLAQRLDDLARLKAEQEAAKTRDEFQDDLHDAEELMEDEEDYEYEEAPRQRIDDRRSLTRSGESNPKNPILLKKHKPDPSPPSPARSLSSSQGPTNPFRMGSPSKQAKGTRGKSFFDSVEEEGKRNALMNKNKISPESKSEAKKKRGKQTTLLNGSMKNDKAAEKTKSTVPPAKKVSGFNLWMEQRKQSLTEEEAEISNGDLVKVAMKEWKSLDEEEKLEWNSKAKAASAEQDEKKRKREKHDNENENITDKNNSVNKQAKKLKPMSGVESGSAGSKLAGFAYKKN